MKDLSAFVKTARAIGADCVSFGVRREPYEFLSSLPGARKSATFYDTPDEGIYVIEAVMVVVENMELRAQAPSRPPTPEEAARACDRGFSSHKGHSYRASALE